MCCCSQRIMLKRKIGCRLTENLRSERTSLITEGWEKHFTHIITMFSHQGLNQSYQVRRWSVDSTRWLKVFSIGFEEFTGSQLFFMAFGNLWCETMTPTGLKFSLEDSHCRFKNWHFQFYLGFFPSGPGKIRMLGVLSNFREFHDAFKCHTGQRYHRSDDQKCIIW